MNTDPIRRAIGSTQRLIGGLPTKAEVERMKQELTDAYDDLTADYMEELEKLMRLEVIAPEVQVGKVRVKKVRDCRGFREGSTVQRMYLFLLAEGPQRLITVMKRLEVSKPSVYEAVKSYKDIYFRNVRHGVWEAIPKGDDYESVNGTDVSDGLGLLRV